MSAPLTLERDVERATLLSSSTKNIILGIALIALGALAIGAALIPFLVSSASLLVLSLILTSPFIFSAGGIALGIGIFNIIGVVKDDPKILIFN